MPQGLIIGIVGTIVIVVGGTIAMKVLKEKSKQTQQQTRQKYDDSKSIVSNAEKRKSFEKIIPDLVQQKDKAMLNEFLNDPNCQQFPDLIAKIKEELRKMG